MGRSRGYERIHKSVGSAVRTTAGDSGEIQLLRAQRARVFIKITALGGTGPTLTVFAEDSPNGTDWYALANSGSLSTVGNFAFNVTGPMSDAIRLRWALGGTGPSVTFEISVYYE